MDAVLQALLNGLLTYIEDNPEDVKLLVQEGIAYLVSEARQAIAAAQAAKAATPPAPATPAPPTGTVAPALFGSIPPVTGWVPPAEAKG